MKVSTDTDTVLVLVTTNGVTPTDLSLTYQHILSILSATLRYHHFRNTNEFSTQQLETATYSH